MIADFTYPTSDVLRRRLLVYLLHADGPPLTTTLHDLARLVGLSGEDEARTYVDYPPVGNSSQNVWKAKVADQIKKLRTAGLMTASGTEGHVHDRQTLTGAGREEATAIDDEEVLADSQRFQAASADDSAQDDACLDPAVRALTTTYRFLRDTRVARQAKRMAGYACQLCGAEGIPLAGGALYAEAHHIIPLYEGGPDVLSNLVCVCPSCHAALDFLARPIPDAVATASTYPISPQAIQHHNDRVARREHGSLPESASA